MPSQLPITFLLSTALLHTILSFSTPPPRIIMSPVVPRRALVTSIRAATDSWDELRAVSLASPVGAALEADAALRASGGGEAHVGNKLRTGEAGSTNEPRLTLYRDVAGWCPYCQKTVMLLEEKGVPCRIETVPMRSYGDKPTSFTRLVPSGLLPALVVDNRHVVTESQVIMELIEEMYPAEDGYPASLPPMEDAAGWDTYRKLARLERDLFGRWWNLIFRPEGPPIPGAGLFERMLGGGPSSDSSQSPAMKGFTSCLDEFDVALRSSPGPWLTTLHGDRPAMIDLIFVSHLERMLASCAFWKGLKIRGSGRWPGIDAWFDAFDKRPSYRAFRSDFYTNVMDIPPQYGPGYFGGDSETQERYAKIITGADGKSWSFPLPPDSDLEPLHVGPPLPPTALEAAGISDAGAVPSPALDRAARHAAAWKLSSNGKAVAAFAARGAAGGASNPRRTFAAPLADPYADPCGRALPAVDATLRIVCRAMLDEEAGDGAGRRAAEEGWPEVNTVEQQDVRLSLAYLRDRVGVPRDMHLISARQFRAYLNWAIDSV